MIFLKEKAKALLLLHEDIKLMPYKCTSGRLTIGIGRNLEDNGISTSEAFMMLENDILACQTDLSFLIFPHQFYDFPENIQLVLIDMRFQLGGRGFRAFKKMIFAFQNLDYTEAIEQMKDSKWYGQVKTRADHLIKMVIDEIK